MLAQADVTAEEAAKLGIPVSTGVMDFAYEDGAVTVKREIEGGGEEVGLGQGGGRAYGARHRELDHVSQG